jgi:putative ABC transport system permease protein
VKLGNVLLLYRVRLGSRLVQELLAALGIAVGVALLFSSQIASASLEGSQPQLIGGVIGGMRLELAARGPAGFDARLLGAVQRLPGVRAAMPVLEQRATISGPRGQASILLVSTEARFARLGGPLLRHFGSAQLERQQALALPLPLARAVGLDALQSAELQIGARRVSAFLGAVLLEDEIGALVHSPTAIAPLPYAQRLGGMRGRLSAIFVAPAPGREGEVRAGLSRLAAGRLNVEPANFEATLFAQAAGPASQAALLFATISALVGFMFALSAILFTVPQRRNLVEDLRLDGYARPMILEILLFDALVLGVVASLLGLALGDLFSLALFRSSPGYLSFAFTLGSLRIVTWQSAALAVAGGLLAALAGVLLPLQADVFARLSHGARSGRVSRRGALLAQAMGLLCLALTALILLAAPQAAVLGMVCLVAALLLLLAPAIRVLLGAIDRASNLLGTGALYLATIELRSDANRARSLAVAATGAVAVFGSVAIQGAHANLQRGLDGSARAASSFYGVWVAPAGLGNLLVTTPFAPSSQWSIARLPGVRSLSVYRGGLLDYGPRRVWVLAPAREVPRPIPASQLTAGGLELADTRLRAGGWAAISPALAAEHHLRIGERFVLPSPHPMPLRVAALITNMGWAPGAIIMNATDYARAWASAAVSGYGLTLAPGSSIARLSAALRRTLGPGSALTVETAAEHEARGHEASRQGLAELTQIASLVLIAAVLAMGTAMGAMIWQRRRRLADMKVDGFSRGVLWRALLIESAVLLGGGCAIGAALGLFGQLLLSHALAVVTGFPVLYSIGALQAVGTCGLVTLVALATLVLPGYLAARVRPALVLQD